MLSTLIQIYNGVTDRKGDVLTAEAALNRIKDGTYKKEIERLRTEPDKAKKDKLKQKLPAVTWSGTFETRNAKNLIEYSQLICIDIDKLTPEEIEEITENIIDTDVYIFSFFISPSGNGLKILFLTETEATEHTKVFVALQNYIESKYQIKIDESGKDICRLCFLSYDENLYLNNDEICTIDKEFIDRYTNHIFPAVKPTVKKVPEQPRSEKTTDQLLDEVRIFTNNKVTYTDGDRNNYVHQFACNANRKGIDYTETLEYCNSSFMDLDFTEIQATVKSAYGHNTHENGKFSPQNNSTHHTKKTTVKTAQNTAQQEYENGKPEDIEFWHEEENEKTGKTSVKFDYDKGDRWLAHHGFYKIPMDNNNYQFIRVQNNIIDIVKERNMREYMIDFLEKDYHGYRSVRQMLKRGIKTYTSTHYLEGLPYFAPKFKKDTADMAYIYFKNCFLEITKTGIVQKKYSELSGNIWRKQIIDFDFELKEYHSCIYDQFLELAIIGRKSDNDLNDTEKEKLKSVLTTTGYLLHKYKDAANPKAIVAVDQKLRDGKEDNGGTGKSMHSKAISKIIHTCTIDGKNFKFDSPYPFEKVNLDHSLINFNDVNKNFDFERLYGLLTEEFTYSKKYLDAITIAFEDSPKFYISTNRTIKGAGNSVTRRQHIIEFSSYFNSERTPQKEFGHMFFYQWNNAEWNNFYLFMLNCIVMYLKAGLTAFPLENYHLNKLIDTAGEEFIDFMDDEVLETLKINDRFCVKDLFDDYLKLVQNSYRKNTAQNTFSKNVRMWCDIHNLEINAHKNHERDRSNGKDYFTFTTKIN